ncbi:hypothetical protein [Vulgatibacter incomptus]|uniref:Uncharacterized protein n=1 Tax=Vulgatibacter incomptus TaxID=1391653 RepID=A0A0K1PAM7_9BACT|nr:hypothetical protein [Vulgatibacter incomptus]AKU90557.1 hypothetical protein AKJ08_0944 [Vulgatibacter incomptus]
MGDRLTEGLSFEWRAERHAETLLEGMAEAVAQVASPELATRLTELSASAQARRSRIERRLAALFAVPRLAPVPPIIDRLDEALELALAQTRASADRYAALAELSRRLSDPETAFVCELNRTGAEESAMLIDGLLALEVDRRARLSSGGSADAPL